MCVTLAQAAVQLVLLVLMACVPGEWGWDQWGLGLTRGRVQRRGPTTPRTHSPSSSPVSLSRSLNVESRLDTRVHCPSRLKQVQVMGPGERGEVGRWARLGPPLLPLPLLQSGHTHCPRSLRRVAPSSGHSASLGHPQSCKRGWIQLNPQLGLVGPWLGLSFLCIPPCHTPSQGWPWKTCIEVNS